MLTASRWLLLIAGILLIMDAIMMFANIPWILPLPCPGSLLLLGVGILLFALGSKAFKKE